MKLIEYLNSHENWESELSSDPYYLKIVWDGDYCLLKYNQIESDFSYEEVREARGIIFKKVGDSYECVCHPFYKFFNYGEPYAADIDWESARVMEKIDGSLMKLWYDDGWHLSSNGAIDAFAHNIGIFDYSLGELFETIIGEDYVSWAEKYFEKDYTYCFELVAPENRVVAEYEEDGIYYLAHFARDGRECPYMSEVPPQISKPKQYHFKDFNELLASTQSLSKDEEGYVVVDKYHNRIKVKSKKWLEAFCVIKHTSKASILNLIREEKIDDFLGYAPMYRELADCLKYDYLAYVAVLNIAWRIVSKENFDSKKDYAIFVKENFPGIEHWLFKKYADNDLAAEEYAKSIPAKKILKIFEE